MVAAPQVTYAAPAPMYSMAAPISTAYAAPVTTAYAAPATTAYAAPVTTAYAAPMYQEAVAYAQPAVMQLDPALAQPLQMEYVAQPTYIQQ